MDADLILAEILQTALDIDADASGKKHKLTSGTQEFGYQQGRADTARIFCARGIEFAQAWRAIMDQYRAAEADRDALREALANLSTAIADFHFAGPNDRSAAEWEDSGTAVRAAWDAAKEILVPLSDCNPRTPYAPPAVVFTHRFTPPRRPTIAERFWLAIDRLHERIVARICPPPDPMEGHHDHSH